MFERFHKLPEMYQGFIALFIGMLLLLHALGFAVLGIKIIILLFAIYLLMAGFIKSGLYKKVTELIERAQEKHK